MELVLVENWREEGSEGVADNAALVTGKTSLAKAAASRAAKMLSNKVQFIEVEPHNLTSGSLGKTQRDTHNFLTGTIAEHAKQGPLIVLLDEVETLAVDRQRLSLEANPIDVHRATDAVLAALDNPSPYRARIDFNKARGTVDRSPSDEASGCHPVFRLHQDG
jgi:AAA+ superfamily predicted ATPase